MKIYTKRFILKKINPKLVNKNYAKWLEEGLESRLFNIKVNDNTESSIKKYIKKKLINNNILFLSIHFRDKHKNFHIGNIKFEPINKNNTSTLGILIGDKNWRGKGVFAEILSKLVIVLKYKYGVKKINLGVEKKNYHAIYVYKKNGFKINKSFYKSYHMTKYL